MSDLSIFTLNVKGFRDKNKRRECFLWLQEKKPSIIFLQETHSTSSDISLWTNEWGAKALWSHGSSNSRGTAILFNKNLNISILKCMCDPNGRYVIVDVKILDKVFTLINIYAPNDDCPQFFTQIDNLINQFHGNSIIFGGDFNCVLNLSLDKKGGRMHTNFQARSEIFEVMKKRCLVDIWRELNPNSKRFTWRSNSDPPIMCRLDFFLISKNLKSCIDNSIISNGYRTDHNLVSIHMNDNYEKPGKGFWKFNVSLLNDLDYINMVKENIGFILEENKDANPQILWETIKCVIRGDTIRYSVKKARERKKLEIELEKEIDRLENLYCQSLDPQDLATLNVKKRELESLYDYKAKGAMIRSKARWIEDGEKNSSYFFNLEKYHFSKKKCV